MKKIYTYILMIACAMMFAGCQKDLDDFLTAEIEDFEGADGKVYINNKFACWHDGDDVKVNGIDCIVKYDPREEGRAYIKGKTQDVFANSATEFLAVYPANCYNANPPSDTWYPVQYTFPKEQVYREQADAMGQMVQVVDVPMMATTKTTSDKNTLKFKNVGALLNVNFPNTIGKDINVTSIEIERLNGRICGDVLCRLSGDYIFPVALDQGDGDNVIKMTVPGNLGKIVASASKDFYVAVPPMTGEYKEYAPNLVIRVSYNYQDDNGNVVRKKYTSKPTNPNKNINHKIEKNKIYPLSLSSTTCESDVELAWEGEGTLANPYKINTLADLLKLNNQLDNNVYFEQTAPITITATDNFEGISNFAGHYNGGGFTIHMGTQDEPCITGLFSNIYLNDRTVRNIDIENLKMDVHIVNQNVDGLGAILSSIKADVYTQSKVNVTLANCEILAGSNIACGDNKNVSGRQDVPGVGGFIGAVSVVGAVTINNCINCATIAGGEGVDGGGIIGSCDNSWNANGYFVKIEDCKNYGNITMTMRGRVGGILGYIKVYTKGEGIINKCVNYGEVKHTSSTRSSDYGIGGIIGGGMKVTIKNCANHGSVSGMDYVGGIAGDAWSADILNSYVAGSVSGSDCGGLAGYLGESCNIENAYVKQKPTNITNEPMNAKWIIKMGYTTNKYKNVYRPVGDVVNKDNDGVANGVSTYADNATLLQTLNTNRYGHSDWAEWVEGANGPKLNFEN